MDKKILAIVVAVIIVVAVVIAGVYIALSGGTGAGGTGGDTAGNNIAGANSLQYTVAITSGGSLQSSYTYSAKNIGTENMMMRIEGSTGSDSYIYILNGAEETMWVYTGGEWVDFSEYFDTYWNSWNGTWTGYVTYLDDWNGTGDYLYSDTEGNSVRVYDITVNPTLADSLFQHT